MTHTRIFGTLSPFHLPSQYVSHISTMPWAVVESNGPGRNYLLLLVIRGPKNMQVQNERKPRLMLLKKVTIVFVEDEFVFSYDYVLARK